MGGNLVSAPADSGKTVGDDEEGGEPLLEPEKVYKNEDDKDIYLHEAACKLFRHDKEQNEWRDAGKCTLRIQKERDTEKQKLLIRDAMGKLLENTYFLKGMKFDVMGKKNNSIRFMAPWENQDKVIEMRSLMIKMKESDVPRTLQKLEDAVKSL